MAADNVLAKLEGMNRRNQVIAMDGKELR